MATAEQIQYHYDVDASFFASFLDAQYRVYSCAVWQSEDDTLETAQQNKLERLAKYAAIRSGHRVLDVGCGWGGMLEYVTKMLGAREAVGLTLSRDQQAFIRRNGNPCMKVRLSSWDKFVADERFDSVVSIGAFEHFASREDRSSGRHENIYRMFFEKCAALTEPDSFIGLQTIVTSRAPRTRHELRDVRYLLDRVFPGSALPTINDIQAATIGLYEVRELRTIGSDYARTLEVWAERLMTDERSLVDRYGRELFEHYRRYFAAAKRNFENGITDLLQVSLRKLPMISRSPRATPEQR